MTDDGRQGSGFGPQGSERPKDPTPSSLTPTHPHAHTPTHLLLILALSGLVFLWSLGRSGIFDLDEGLYAEAAREMRLTGDWVTPRVNGAPFFEKPPLIYWLAALSIRFLGTNEFAARLP